MLREEEKLLQETMVSLMSSLDMNSTRERLHEVESKVKRISILLHELQGLSKACEDLQESCKEKEVRMTPHTNNSRSTRIIFTRRILQLKTELEDAKDLLYTLVESRLSPRQLSLLDLEQPYQDPSFDPSIRFFGIDWEAIFGRCFNVSISIRVFSSNLTSQGDSIDIVLLNSIFSDLSRIEAEIDSHAEAVLNGRLSKSQLRLIQEEQTRLKTIITPPRRPLSKAKSFRETSGSKRALSKYRKTKTSELAQHRFSEDLV
ncbi:Uncharacterized protein FKW44_001984 [Caligus rogercresseyi]|uniref:Uncharacterized protein n=1 Tax=Caligus rogercresseyi TaxID=217165 RepID=A0A7T8KJH4_CALRO|nr:Uncharacterized protein FKW44_001984 [Caligus rogercresseyi]